MKKLDCLHINSSEELTQERINDLQEDLLTILEAHSEDVELHDQEKGGVICLFQLGY